MKAILEFDLNLPEDRQTHMRCIKAADMAIVLFDLRRVRKFVEGKLESKTDLDYNQAMDTVDLVFTEINDLLEQQGINIDELIR